MVLTWHKKTHNSFLMCITYFYDYLHDLTTPCGPMETINHCSIIIPFAAPNGINISAITPSTSRHM